MSFTSIISSPSPSVEPRYPSPDFKTPSAENTMELVYRVLNLSSTDISIPVAGQVQSSFTPAPLFPDADLDFRSIEEVMEDLHQAVYELSLKSMGTPEDSASKVYRRLNDPLPNCGSQPVLPLQVLYVALDTVIPGEIILSPAVPIPKVEYFDMEAFERAESQKVINSFVDILWSKTYPVARPAQVYACNRSQSQSLGADEAERFFDFSAFEKDQVRNSKEESMLVDEPFAHSAEFNLRSSAKVDQSDRSLNLPPGAVDGQHKWRDVFRSVTDLGRQAQHPSEILRDVSIVEPDANALDVWFPDFNGGGLHRAKVVLSDRYVLVPLPARTPSYRVDPTVPTAPTAPVYSSHALLVTAVDPQELVAPESSIASSQPRTTPKSKSPKSGRKQSPRKQTTQTSARSRILSSPARASSPTMDWMEVDTDTSSSSSPSASPSPSARLGDIKMHMRTTKQTRGRGQGVRRKRA